ncbi:MAG: transglutaminase domain-containing protein [Desulfobacterales bacterium]|nr:transglutaminase domain-containing protein [Desulfobacterales bacterium]
MAIILEGSRLIKVRWDFPQSYLYKIIDICAMMLIGLSGYFISVNLSQALYKIVLWMPVPLFPLMVFQAYSTTGKINIRSFFLLLRKKNTLASDRKLPDINLAYPYLAFCIISASAANIRNIWFYAGQFIIITWALWSFRSKKFSIKLWLTIIILAGLIGYVGHIGLNKLQSYTTDWFAEFFIDDFDPYRNRTAIGDIGTIDPSSHIIFRVKSNNKLPDSFLLRESCYNIYSSKWWFAYQSNFESIKSEENLTSWKIKHHIQELTNKQMITIAAYLKKGKGLLKIPIDTIQIDQLPVLTMKRNQYGTVLVEDDTGLLIYDAVFGGKELFDSSPTKQDLFIPASDESAINEINKMLDLKSKSPTEILETVKNFFNNKFEYSLIQNSKKQGVSPLEDFLTRTKSGHCEYFATASVLLLRSANIPARYATGYVVDQKNRIDEWIAIRGRHAHAWTLAFINGTWCNFDSTPPSRSEIEEETASTLESVFDLWSQLIFKLYEWRLKNSKEHITKYLWGLIILLLCVMTWRLYSKKQAVKRVKSYKDKEIISKPFPGKNSEFYLIETILTEKGYFRYPWETTGAWIERISNILPLSIPLNNIKSALLLHYKYRFDPEGINSDEKEALKNQIQIIISLITKK